MITDRLKQIIDYSGITPNAFAAKIGISQPRISNYLKGREPDFDTLSRICRTFVMIDPRWLLTGEGEMIVKESNFVDDSPKAEHVSKLIEIIHTQAETLLEQQRFINSSSGKIPPPLQNNNHYPDKEEFKG